MDSTEMNIGMTLLLARFVFWFNSKEINEIDS